MNDKKYIKNAYNSDYNKNHYKDLKIRVKFDEYYNIIKFCNDMNISINKLFVKSVQFIINNDLLDEIMHK